MVVVLCDCFGLWSFMNRDKFLPTTIEDINKLGWDRPDIILVTGDSYIDSPYIGVAIIGRLLASKGFNVAIIAQPDINSDEIARLGEPKLFWGISSGSVDSMVANYTATQKKRRSDDFTPGGVNNKRPDRALIAYSNLVRRHFKNTVPLVLGGIEASLRRVSHYDYWSNKIRKSILFDAKANYLIFGMGEKSILDLAHQIKNNESCEFVKGLCYISKEIPKGYLELPSFDICKADKKKFTEMFHQFYINNDPKISKGLVQQQDQRYLIQNPLMDLPDTKEIDTYYGLPFTFNVHPDCESKGFVKAMDTINNSITTHRGCYGECNFCSIAVHQGTTIVQRSEKSIMDEAKKITSAPKFNGIIRDVGGPTANMYGMECSKKLKKGRCLEKRCLYPKKCSSMPLNHKPILDILEKIRKLPNVKKAFVASGIRYDMILDDEKSGMKYLDKIVKHHVSGQMKIAPEHSEENVLRMMGKPGASILKSFVKEFNERSRKADKKQFLTYYLIAAHPGCSTEDMAKLKDFASREFRISPEQVQVFTPLPSTYSALMYYTERDPWTGEKIRIEKEIGRKVKQKEILTGKIKKIRKKK